MKKPHKLILSWCFLAAIPNSVFAAEDLATACVLGGFGSAQTTDVATDQEGPYSMGFQIDYTFTSKIQFGAEHIRTLSLAPMSTAISFTGVDIKYYYPNNVPTPYYSQIDAMPSMTMITRDISTYVGAAIGFAQSSLPAENNKSSSAAGLYISAKGGVNYQLSPRWGLRGEMNIIQMVTGTGKISGTNMMGGLYLNF